MPTPTSLTEIDRVFEIQRQNQSGTAPTMAERRRKIQAIERVVLARRDEIRAAMWADFEKPAEEVDLSEIYPVVSEARHAVRHIRRWMTPRRVPSSLALLGSSSRIIYEPKGLVLIISPWNFPFNLTLGPLVAAIAAGNRVTLKPSELTPHSSACIKRVVGEIFNEEEVAVIEGDATTAEALLDKNFDHIFFTGSPAVGKRVMSKAAEHLTSVTLELGGKSPVIVDRTADLDEAATKIVWGKFINAGQLCVAPDYVLVDESVHAPFVERISAAIRSMDCGRASALMVTDRHAARVQRLCDDAVAAGAELIAESGTAGDSRRMPPTVLVNVRPDSAVMQEEIFGPLLPLLTYRTLDDAIAFVNAREKPLVSYIFSRKPAVADEILKRTRAGATVINHTLIHFFQLNLPFGGAGQSGMGKGHGFFGFEVFSNQRAVLDQRTRFSPIALMFPPYTPLKRRLIDFSVRFL